MVVETEGQDLILGPSRALVKSLASHSVLLTNEEKISLET